MVEDVGYSGDEGEGEAISVAGCGGQPGSTPDAGGEVIGGLGMLVGEAITSRAKTKTRSPKFQPNLAVFEPI